MIQNILEKLIQDYLSDDYFFKNKRLDQASHDIKKLIREELVKEIEGKKRKPEKTYYTSRVDAEAYYESLRYDEALSEAVKIIEEKLK